ncbi:TetR/AcrR family transcriptional regulator [Paraburkholderia sp. MM5477-R1]|uniref:TetR/AcrR family transcriptional regulator n=1 Tax=Paraburkholderia sp. MM5477-R1 TaxID=2991062 RepID=UPI003D255CB7
MATDLLKDHRTRVGTERRGKTRARLLKSALLVFAEKGPAEPIIDDVIALAGMSRGSFYNYFRTNEELLEAVAAEVTNEWLRVADPIVRLYEDPAIRVTCGTMLLLHAMRSYPLLSAFLSRMQIPAAGRELLGIRNLTRDVLAGIERHRFAQRQPRAVIDIVVGAIFCAARSLSQEMLPNDYLDDMVVALLLSLGMTEDEAVRLVALPFPDLELDDQSLLKRTLEGAGNRRAGA